MSDPNKPERLRISNADLPPELLSAIGDVTVNWAYVLNLVEVAIWGMLGLTTKQGSALTSRFRFNGKMDMFTATGELYFKDHPELARFKDIRKQIFDRYSERNAIEHATWQHFFANGPSIRVRILKDRSIEAKAMSAKDVDKLGQDIIKLVMTLNDFMTQHIPEPVKTSPDKSA